MTNRDKPPFARVALYDDPLLVGAQWWQESMALVDPIARRRALLGIAAVVAGAAVIGGTVKACSDDDVEAVPSDATKAQAEHGWNFGSDSDALTFEGEVTGTYPPAMFDDLALAILLLAIGVPRAVLAIVHDRPIEGEGAVSMACVVLGLLILLWRNTRARSQPPSANRR